MTADDRLSRPSAGHPDLDELAESHAGALDRLAAERLHGHVASCEQCAAAIDGLDAVQMELQALPAPPLPAEVAARVDATLADLRAGTRLPAGPDGEEPGDLPVAARAGRGGRGPADLPPARPGRDGDEPAAIPAAAHASQDGDGPAGRGSLPAARRAQREADELGLARERRRRRLGRALGGIAAAVAVLAAGASVTALVRSGGAGGDSPSSAAGAGAADSAAPAARSGGYVPNSTTRDGTATLGGGAVPGYDHDTLAAALPTIADQSVSQPHLAASAGVMSDAGRRAACAGSIPSPRGTLRTAGRIVYEGRPAYVFVYADGDRLTGYVVTDACGSAAGLPATVLDTVP